MHASGKHTSLIILKVGYTDTIMALYLRLRYLSSRCDLVKNASASKFYVVIDQSTKYNLLIVIIRTKLP